MPETEEAVKAEHRAKQAVEYGTYVAVQDIYYDGVLAYREGHAVPVSNVERHDYLTLGVVAPVEKAAATPTTEHPADPQIDLTKPKNRG